MAEFEIRPAGPDEAALLTGIALAAKRHWGYPERWITLWTPLLTLAPEDILKGGVFVGIMGKEVAGFYRLRFDAPRARLDDLWIKPEFIGRGLGRALFAHALAGARAAGARLLEIEADPNAQGFYEKMGAHRIGERMTRLDGRPRALPIMEIAL